MSHEALDKEDPAVVVHLTLFDGDTYLDWESAYLDNVGGNAKVLQHRALRMAARVAKELEQ